MNASLTTSALPTHEPLVAPHARATARRRHVAGILGIVAVTAVAAACAFVCGSRARADADAWEAQVATLDRRARAAEEATRAARERIAALDARLSEARAGRVAAPVLPSPVAPQARATPRHAPTTAAHASRAVVRPAVTSRPALEIDPEGGPDPFAADDGPSS